MFTLLSYIKGHRKALSIVILIFVFSIFTLLFSSRIKTSLLSFVNNNRSFENFNVGKSDINGLYYTKRHDGKPDLYSTAYANQILKLLGLKFSEKTYNIILNNQKSDGTFRDSEASYDYPIFTTYLSYLVIDPKKVSNEQMKATILKYKQADGSFFDNDLSNSSDSQDEIIKMKITFTYMSLYILKERGVDLSNYNSTVEWLNNNITRENVKNNIKLCAKIAESLNLINHDLPVPLDIFNSKIQDIISKISYSELDVNVINDLEGFAILNNIGIININNEDKDKIRIYCLNMISNDISDKQIVYQLINSYVKFKGNINKKEVISLSKKILAEELIGGGIIGGGISGTNYLGSPKETLMTLVIMKENNNLQKDKHLNDTLKMLLVNFINEKESRLDNGDIYSLIASIKLLNLVQLNDNQKNFIIKKMKPFLLTNLTTQNWRDWFYSVKTLELINYNFNDSDLPQNYNTLFNNLTKDGTILFSSNQNENEILNALIIDGLASITKNVKEIEKVRTSLINMVDTNKDDELVLKKRYYATVALIKLGSDPANIDETLNIAEEFKYNSGYKANKNMADSDLQSTFQVVNLRNIKNKKGADLYR